MNAHEEFVALIDEYRRVMGRDLEWLRENVGVRPTEITRYPPWGSDAQPHKEVRPPPWILHVPNDWQEYSAEQQRAVHDAALVQWVDEQDGYRQGMSFAIDYLAQRADQASRLAGDREFSASQKERARQSRRPEMAEILERLAARPGDSGELWPELWAALDREMMDPKEIATPSGDLQYQYHDRQGKLQTISKRRFATRLSEFRKPQ